MMRHPFHEIVEVPPASHVETRWQSDDKSSSNRRRDKRAGSAPPLTIGRRGFFGALVAGIAGCAAFLLGRQAEAWPWRRWRSSRDYREDDYRRNDRSEGRESDDDGRVTTQAIGEEGSGYRPPRSGPITTQAIGEEGSGFRPPRDPNRPGPITTQAIGEEGSGFRPPHE